MSPRTGSFCLAGLLLLILGATSQPAAVNERCPVMPEELAKAIHEITFRGVPVRFCCQQCKAKFLRNPEPYLANLPHVPKTEVKPAPAPELPFLTRLLNHPHWRTVENGVERWRWLLVAAFFILVVHLIAIRWQKKLPTEPPRRSAVAGMVRVTARPSTLLVLAGGMALFWLVQPAAVVRNPAQASGGDSSSHAIGGEFQAQLARQGIMQGPEFVSRMEKTYYRGNDDRSAKLFNGGIYRTCEFRISLRNSGGKTVAAGDALHDQPLTIRVEIHRSKNTMESHFDDKVMTETLLICRADLPSLPPADAANAPVPFKVIQPGQIWAAEATIGEPLPTGVAHLNGTVLISPAAGDTGDQSWQQAHYGIAYRLRFEDGSLARSSKIWMGALVQPLDLSDDQFYQWFDIKPLPEVPDDFQQPAETQPVEDQPQD